MTSPDAQTQRHEADPTNTPWKQQKGSALESLQGIIPAGLTGSPFF